MAGKTYETATLEVIWLAEGADFLLSLPSESTDQNLSSTSHFEWSLVDSLVKELYETIIRSNRGGDVYASSWCLENTGRKLYNLIFPPPIQYALNGLCTRFLLLRLQADLASIPWEVLHDGRDFLGCRFAVGIVVVEWAGSSKAEMNRPSDSFSLLVLSDPCGDLPAAKAEGKNISQYLRSNPRLEVEWLNGSVSWSTAKEFLPRFHGVHYSGHAETLLQVGTYGSWRFDDGVLDWTGIHRMAQSSSTGIPLLIFSNACRAVELPQFISEWGKDHSLEKCFSQVEAFIREGCKHIIGPFGDVSDEGGREFALRFYEHITDGSPIGKGVQEARLHMRTRQQEHGLTWSQYRLFGDPTVGLFGDRLLLPEYRVLVFTQPLGDETHSSFDHIPSIIEVVTDLVQSFPDAELNERSSSGLLVSFPRPSDAIRFSVLLQQRIVESYNQGFVVRCGIHAGEMLIQRRTAGSQAMKLEGESVDFVRLLAEVGLPGQILVSRQVFDSARSVIHGQDLFVDCRVAWLDHGTYRFQGFEEPIGVCEVGEIARAPLFPPPDSIHALRHLYSSPDEVLGWRPAFNVEIPTAPGWIPTEKLGEGGFGEVWRARHKSGVETRVFKFCFRADRVRSLKREATLFRMLRDAVGDHPLIVHIFSVQLESPPYYIEMEDVPGSDLLHWCQRYGGVDSIPLEVRLDIVAQTAEALQGAHDAGIIHRDVKPSNILVVGDPAEPEKFLVKLCDFGIGQILAKDSITATPFGGFSETFTPTEFASHSGTRLYMAPELLTGHNSSIRSDIYSLGVVLYQLVVADLTRPLTSDWRDEVKDPLVQEDLNGCLSRLPESRFEGAGELARRLHRLPERRRESDELRKITARRRWQRNAALIMSVTVPVLLLFVLCLGYGLYQAHIYRKKAEGELYLSSVKLAEIAVRERQFTRAQNLLLVCPPDRRHWEWGHLLYQCNRDLLTLRGHEHEVGSVVVSPDGKWIASGGADGTIRIWDIPSGNSRYILRKHTKPVWALAVSPDGKLLASGSADSLVYLWDPSTGRLTNTWHEARDEVTALAFSQNGEHLFWGSRDGVLRWRGIKDVTDYHQLASAEGEQIISLSVTPDQSHVALVIRRPTPNGATRSVRIHSLPSGEIHPLMPPLDYGWSVAFSPDGRFLMISDDKVHLSLWDWCNGVRIRSFIGHEGKVWSMSFDKDGKLLVTAGRNDGLIKVWDFETGDCRYTFEGHERGVFGVSFSPIQNVVVSSGEDGTIKMWYMSTPGNPDRFTMQGKGVDNFAFSPDGRYVHLQAHYQNPVVSVDTQKKKIKQVLPPGRNRPYSLDYTPEHGILAVGDIGGIAGVYDIVSGCELDQIDVSERRNRPYVPISVQLSPNGDRLLTWERIPGGEATLWDLSTNNLLAHFEPSEKTDSILDAEWSSDSSNIVFCFLHKGTVEIRSNSDLEINSVVEAHQTGIQDIDFSRDGCLMVTASNDTTAKVWFRDNLPPVVLSGHRELLREVALTADGKRILTGDGIGLIKVWLLEGETPREVTSLRADFHVRLCAMEFSPDDQILVTGGENGTVGLWPAFPWDDIKYTGEQNSTLATRIESYKRNYWDGVYNWRSVSSQGSEKLYCNSISSISPSVLIIDNASLELRIREALMKPKGHIFASETFSITSLDLNSLLLSNLNILEYFPNLENLDLRNVGTEIFSPVSRLSHLESLDLGQNHIKDISFISNLRQLRVLEIDENDISDLTPIGGLSNLHWLCMVSNQVSNISPLSKLRGLRSLDISENPISNLSPLSALGNLRNLRMKGLPSADLASLSECRNLRTLTTHGTPIQGLDNLGHLPQLHKLWSNHGKIHEINSLEQFRSLKLLDLTGNQFTDLSPLIKNPFLDAQCRVWISDNPIIESVRTEQIKILRGRGVTVEE